MNLDHAEAQYYILPKTQDNAELIVDIVRKAAACLRSTPSPTARALRPTGYRNGVVLRLQPCHIPDASARDACRDWLQAAYSRKVPWWPPVRRRGVETSALQPSHSPDSPLRDFVPTIGLQGTYSQFVLSGFRPSKRCGDFCANPAPQGI